MHPHTCIPSACTEDWHAVNTSKYLGYRILTSENRHRAEKIILKNHCSRVYKCFLEVLRQRYLTFRWSCEAIFMQTGTLAQPKFHIWTFIDEVSYARLTNWPVFCKALKFDGIGQVQIRQNSPIYTFHRLLRCQCMKIRPICFAWKGPAIRIGR